MVFLATSTNSFAEVPGLTGSQDAEQALAPDATVPAAIPAGRARWTWRRLPPRRRMTPTCRAAVRATGTVN